MVRINRRATLWIGMLAVATASTAQAAVPIFGGLTYNPTTHTGYMTPTLEYQPGQTAGNGSAVAYARSMQASVDLGSRAFRWDGTTAIELGNLGTGAGGVTNTQARSINVIGTAVGQADKYSAGVALGSRAVRWNSAGVAAELPSLSLDASNSGYGIGYAINNAGTTVGTSSLYSSNTLVGYRATRWDAAGNAVQLDPLTLDSNGSTFTNAYAINSSGTVAGVANLHAGSIALGGRGVRWNAGGTSATQLDALSTNTTGYTVDTAIAINDAGTIVGSGEMFSGNTDLGTRAVRWNAGGTAITELGTISTRTGGFASSLASDINASGMTVGFGEKYNGNNDLGSRPVRWSATSTVPVELGILGTSASFGTSSGAANAINDLGTIVGYVNKYTGGGTGQKTAVYWGADDQPVELATLLPANSGWLALNQAKSITNTGWITGVGRYDPNGSAVTAYDRAFLTLVPAAGTYGKGDANFDASINFADLVVLAQHYGQSNAALDVHVADLNLDGTVGFGDLVLLAQNYGTSGAQLDGEGFAPTFAADWALAQSLVPEPTMLMAFAIAARGTCRRRRVS